VCRSRGLPFEGGLLGHISNNMSNQNLPAGAFLTTLNGRRCTAVPRSDIPPPPAATQAATPAAVTANAQEQQQPQATEAGNAEAGNADAASTAETSTSSPEPARTENAQAQRSRASLPAQRAGQATAASDPVQAVADGRSGGVAQQASEQEQAQETATPSEVVVLSTNSRPPSLRPPLIIGSQNSDDRGQGVAAQNAQQGQELPIEAFTANENETASTSLPPTQTPSQNPPPASTAEGSQTDNNLVPATAPAVAAGNQPAAAAAPTPPVASIAAEGVPQGAAAADNDANVAGNLVTTIGLNNAGTAGADNAATTVPSVENGNRQGGIAGAPTAVVAGSVIGGLAVVSLIAFILWFWRKRALRKRRSTLLTPLSVGPSFGRGPNNGEKSYFIDRGSVGPTPKSSKIKAAVGANLKRMFSKERSDSVSVNMNRGNSQFMDTLPGHSRANSSSSGRKKDKGAVTGKDRFMDWWSRLTADVSFNWKLRNDRNAEPDPFTAARDMKEKTNAMGSQPDFLTLLGMDDREVQREAERRQQMHAAKGSASSTDHFLGGLNLNFDAANPFSDSNALPHESAKPGPLVVSQPNNPFSDDNVIKASKPPTSYVAEVRRSRGQSLGGSANNGRNSNAPFSPRVDSMYRESMVSVDPFGQRRNKFRSDPFDLDRPEVLGRQNVTSSNFSTAGSSTAPRLSSNNGDRMSGLPGRPGRAHQRSESFSSKYSSGISLGDWSDPGPDVGPAGRRWDSPTEGWRPGEKRRSGSSQRSVGKAL
jgi:hypothetical protein